MPIDATNAAATAESNKTYWDTTKKAHADSAQVSIKTDANGNEYTAAISNDQLTNNDFLKLMLEELKQQDPTKPQDSAALMDSQLKMSTIQSNQDMSTAMQALQASYSNSALSTAASMVGHTIQNGEVDDKGEKKVFKVNTVENKSGELYMKASQLIGIIDGLKNSETEKLTMYDSNGAILENGEATGYFVALDSEGRFEYNADDSLKILDENNDVVTDQAIKDRYVYGGYSFKYADPIDIPLSSVTAVS